MQWLPFVRFGIKSQALIVVAAQPKSHAPQALGAVGVQFLKLSWCTISAQRVLAKRHWAAFNGLTELLDPRKTRQTPGQRLNSLWFGENYRLKARALS